MKNFKIKVLILVFWVLLFGYNHADAQKQVRFSAFPGYHAINSDEVSSSSNVSKTNWILGGNIAVRTSINNVPLEFSINYSQGSSTIYETNIISPTFNNYSFSLRYRTFPVEILWLNQFTDIFDLLIGINMTAQDRTIEYSNLMDINDDRLLSFGLGLSGRVGFDFITLNSGKNVIYGQVSARWTEFLFHDSKGRNTDDFSYRHLVISPQLGFSYSFN